MAYATVDELAFVLRITVTVKNQDWLAKCLGAAAEEIDHWLGLPAGTSLPDPPPDLATIENVSRAVEWWKASDAAFGGVGFADTGVLTVPRDSFARHAANLMPLVQTYGVA
jgi:hypothetical protein